MFGVIGLLLGIVVLIVFAYRGVSALPLALMAGLVVILTNELPLWSSLAEDYMGGYVGFFKSYFLIFAASALYAKLMDVTGSAVSIGLKFVDWFGSKRAILVVILLTCVLTYGGVSTFVIIFAMAPIVYTLFKAANVTRRLIPGVIGVGACSLTMTALPGTPAIQNIIPTTYLGTTMTAAPIMGILASVLLFLGGWLYCEYYAKKCRLANENFDLPPGVDEKIYQTDRSALPSPLISFLPMVVLIALIISLQKVFSSSAALTVFAMAAASVLIYYAQLEAHHGLWRYQGLQRRIGKCDSRHCKPLCHCRIRYIG